MIPDAAVEAARLAAHAWGEEGDVPERDFLRAILEAAAPHMLASAFDRGRGAGSMDPQGLYPATSPYRSAQ